MEILWYNYVGGLYSMKFIELKNVNKTYKNGFTAIADLSVGVARWEFVCVIGLTASG